MRNPERKIIDIANALGFSGSDHLAAFMGYTRSYLYLMDKHGPPAVPTERMLEALERVREHNELMYQADIEWAKKRRKERSKALGQLAKMVGCAKNG